MNNENRKQIALHLLSLLRDAAYEIGVYQAILRRVNRPSWKKLYDEAMKRDDLRQKPSKTFLEAHQYIESIFSETSDKEQPQSEVAERLAAILNKVELRRMN